MRITHLLAVILTGLLISLMHAGRFRCGVLLCGQAFDSSGALLRHRSSCLYYRQGFTARANPQRKHPLLYNTMTNPVSKKAKLDQVNTSKLTFPRCVMSYLDHLNRMSDSESMAQWLILPLVLPPKTKSYN
jgi:hypothetical protein